MNLSDKTGKLYYVGGCVRDKILGIPSVDTDICYEGDAVDYVTAQGFDIIKIQKEIRTARVLIDGKEIDFASTRKEYYPKAGHMPITTETGCPLKDDLARRDFTINSIAQSVSTGEIIDPTGGSNDIKAGLLRVHHDKSFIDDPTRIIRGLKFSLRFKFNFDSHTEKLKNEYLNNVNYDMSYSRLQKENLSFPDLIIIDGGKGQLSSAVEILNELNIKNQDIVSLAKRIEEVFVPDKLQSIIFPMNSQALFFFQRIRDEAHRYAITYHRLLREKEALHSDLDNIKGLYLKNKKLLLEKYSSVSKISKLTKEELMLLLSKHQAQLVYDYFNSKLKKLDTKNSG